MKNIIAALFFLTGIVAVSNSRLSAEDKSVTLSSLIKEVKERNPEIKSAREKWQSKVSLIVPARTAPDLNLGMMWENIPPEENSLSAAGMKMLSLSQKYPFFGKLSLRGKIARAESEIYAYLLEHVEWKVISRLKKAYYQYFYYQKVIGIYEEMIEIFKHNSRVVEQKYRANQEKQMNVLKVQVELSRFMDEIITLENEKATVQVEINSLLDYPYAKPLKNAVEPGDIPYDFEKEVIIQKALMSSPVLKAAFKKLKKAGAALKLSRKSYLPDFMFNYKRRYVSDDFSGWDAGLNLSLPVYFWKQRGEIKSKKEEEGSMADAYRNMKNEITYKLDYVLTQVDTYSRLYNLYQTNFIPQVEQVWKVAEIGYKAGKVDFIDLLDAERSYLTFKINYWKYLTKYKKSIAELERIAGMDISELKEEK